VIELWTVPAQTLLEIGDVGLLPLLPLTRSRQTPETLVQQCKEHIEQEASPQDRPTLLTVTAIMAGMRSYHAEHWLALLGGKNVVVEHSSVYQYWLAEHIRTTRQADIVSFLEARFGPVPEEVAAHVRTVTDLDKLEQGIRLAAQSASIKAFHKRFAKL
jgi:hypothetical protein